jgi:hypothetical protein
MATYNSPTDQVTGAVIHAASINDIDAACAVAFAALPSTTMLANFTYNLCACAGSGATFTLTPPVAQTALAEGMMLTFIPNASSTLANVTLNVSSLGAVPLYKQTGVAAGAGDLTIGVPKVVMYSQSVNRFYIMS